MPRTWKRKSNRAAYSMDDVLAAVKRVIKENIPIREVARETGIDRMTLTRYKNKCSSHSGDDINDCQLSHIGYWGNRQIFTNEEEQLLADYLKRSCRMYFGLTSEEVRKLAYEFAFKNGKIYHSTGLRSSWQVLTGFKGL